MAKVESSIRAAIDFIDALNRHEIDAMLRLIDPGCTFESASPGPDGSSYAGPSEFSGYWEILLKNTPGIQLMVEETFSAGDRCVMRGAYTWDGPEGTSNHLRVALLFRVRDGLIRELREYAKGWPIPSSNK
jgi:hypothetical protein